MWVRRCLICPAANVAFARQLCSTVAGPSGTGMWPASGWSASGVAPPTHHIEEGCIQDNFANLLPFWTVDAFGVRTLASPGAATTVAALANAAGLVTTQAAVQALFDACDITDQNPFAAAARLGLKQITA